MPRVEVGIFVKQPASNIFKILSNMEQFPLFMKDIKQIKVLQSEKGKIITEWKTDIDGTPVEWIQESVLDVRNKRIRFAMLRGDFKTFRGRWEVLGREEGVAEIIFSVEIDWGVPNFEKYYGSILKKKLYKSVRGMLWALRKEISESR